MMRNSQVMFVDDEEGVRTSWQRFLQDRGITTTTAPDGASAIEELSRRPVDVVVSDLRMPGKDGLELLEWVHERQPETRFILLTGYGDAHVERQVRALGAVDYLEKPVSPDVLAHAVDVALEAGREGRLGLPLPVTEVTPAPVVEAEPAVEVDVATEARPSPLRTAGMLIAAPILGLAFVVFLPVIGIGALFWVIGRQIKAAFWT